MAHSRDLLESPLQETLAAVDLAALQTPQESDLPPLTMPIDAYPGSERNGYTLVSKDNSRNNYFISKSNYFIVFLIIISFPTNFINNYLHPYNWFFPYSTQHGYEKKN